MAKYPRTYHLPWSPGTTSDDRIAKSVDTLLGVDLVITEKLDGENCGMDRGGVYARSHAAYTTSAWSREVRALNARIGRDIPEDEMLFGENMEGIHSIEYSELTSYYYLFGIRKKLTFQNGEERGIWFPWKAVEEYAFLLDIPTVPVLFKGTVTSEKELKLLTEELCNQPSALGGKREGIVIRNSETFLDEEFSKNVMKWVRKNHVSTDEHWTKNWKKAKIKYNEF